MFTSMDDFSPPITIEELKLFHSIDRDIFARLVFGVGRDPIESMQVVAFWLWLERSHCGSLTPKLLSWPLPMLNRLAYESEWCLKCMRTDPFLAINGHDGIVLLQSLTEYKISLHALHENRKTVILGVVKIVNEVCVRAFDDILIGPNVGRVNPNPNTIRNPDPPSPSFYHQVSRARAGAVQFFPSVGFVPYRHGAFETPGAQNLTAFEHRVLNLESNDSRNRSLNADEEDNKVPPDDRTIFLTFSKGYPISEVEVRDFFTRTFGDFIEALYMQETMPGEQALFARLVARSASIIDVIVEKDSKTKYMINGKHVWTRKYVKKKKSRSPARENDSPVRRSSPALTALQQPDYGHWGGYPIWLLMHDE